MVTERHRWTGPLRSLLRIIVSHHRCKYPEISAEHRIVEVNIVLFILYQVAVVIPCLQDLVVEGSNMLVAGPSRELVSVPNLLYDLTLV